MNVCGLNTTHKRTTHEWRIERNGNGINILAYSNHTCHTQTCSDFCCFCDEKHSCSPKWPSSFICESNFSINSVTATTTTTTPLAAATVATTDDDEEKFIEIFHQQIVLRGKPQLHGHNNNNNNYRENFKFQVICCLCLSLSFGRLVPCPTNKWPSRQMTTYNCPPKYRIVDNNNYTPRKLLFHLI